MIKNIPNKYTKEMMMKTLNKGFKGKFDFFYLPIDFMNNCNMGYAFINFSEVEAVKDFFLKFEGMKWEKFNSDKVCSLKYAKLQGCASLINHFKNSRVMNQKDNKFRPFFSPNKPLQSLKSKIEQQKNELNS